MSDDWDKMSAGGSSTGIDETSSLADTVLMDELSGADARDTIYTGAIRVCGTCDETTADLNVFYRCMMPIFSKQTKLYLSKFNPWARHDNKGQPEARCCMKCNFFAYHGFKAQGGVKHLKQVAEGGQVKVKFKAALIKFIARVKSGHCSSWSQAAAVIVEEVSVSTDTSFMQEIAWDFQPVAWLTENMKEWEDDDLKLREIGDSMVRGRWVKATSTFPPDGCHRFVQKVGSTATHKKVVDHSGNKVREEQLAESHVSAIKDVLGALDHTDAAKQEEDEAFGMDIPIGASSSTKAMVSPASSVKLPAALGKHQRLPDTPSAVSSGASTPRPRQRLPETPVGPAAATSATPSQDVRKRKVVVPVSSMPPSKRRRLAQTMESLCESATAVVAQHTTAMPTASATFKVSVLTSTLQKCTKAEEVREALDASAG